MILISLYINSILNVIYYLPTFLTSSFLININLFHYYSSWSNGKTLEA